MYLWHYTIHHKSQIRLIILKCDDSHYNFRQVTFIQSEFRDCFCQHWSGSASFSSHSAQSVIGPVTLNTRLNPYPTFINTGLVYLVSNFIILHGLCPTDSYFTFLLNINFLWSKTNFHGKCGVSSLRTTSWHEMLTHLPWTKWPPFPRRHFQIHFHEWKVLYFDSNFTEVCS